MDGPSCKYCCKWRLTFLNLYPEVSLKLAGSLPQVESVVASESVACFDTTIKGCGCVDLYQGNKVKSRGQAIRMEIEPKVLSQLTVHTNKSVRIEIVGRDRCSLKLRFQCMCHAQPVNF